MESSRGGADMHGVGVGLKCMEWGGADMHGVGVGLKCMEWGWD